MAAKPESRLWTQLRDGTKDLGVFWTRLESWSTPGVPDLHGVKDGQAFWLELKVHRLKTLKNIQLRPHQIAWQIRYSGESGNVWNLVSHPSSRTINIFHGRRAMEIAGQTEDDGPLAPDWSSGTPYDWVGLINHLLNSSSPFMEEEKIQDSRSTDH
jgi:hypothetical protein